MKDKTRFSLSSLFAGFIVFAVALVFLVWSASVFFGSMADATDWRGLIPMAMALSIPSALLAAAIGIPLARRRYRRETRERIAAARAALDGRDKGGASRPVPATPDQAAGGWSLEENERVLWEGAPDPAAPPSDVIGILFQTRLLGGFLLLALAIGLALAAYRLRLTGDTWTVPCADPSLRIELPLKTLDGAASAFCLVAALAGLVFLERVRARRIRRRTRYAVTDRRVLVAVGRRLRAVPRDVVLRVLRTPCDRLDHNPPQKWFGLVLFLRPRRRWQTPERVVIGPLAPASGLACEARLLGLDPAAESGETARALPDWLPDATRRRLLALLSPGERILWMGRPVFRRFPPELVFHSVVVAAGIVWMSFAKALSARETFVGLAETVRFFFVRMGWPFGWLFGTVILSMPVLFLVAIVLTVNWYLPASRRREWSRHVFLVTDRRAVSPYGEIADDPDRLFPPVAKRVGRDRANVYFAARPGSPPPRRPTVFTALGFLDIPAADLPAALAAIEELRRSANPSPSDPATKEGQRP